MELLGSVGITLPDDPTPSDVAEMLRKTDERYRDMVNMATLRSMSKAEYKATNDGHYGLNFADYCTLRRLSVATRSCNSRMLKNIWTEKKT